MTMIATTGQNTTALGALLLGIFLALLALDAIPRVRKRVESLEGDFVAAVMTLSERLGRPVEPAERLVDVPEEAPLLAREQERLLAFHGVGALIRHVERVGAQVAVGGLRRRAERLVIVTQLLQHPATLLEQPLFEVLEVLLVHRLRLLGGARAACGCHATVPWKGRPEPRTHRGPARAPVDQPPPRRATSPGRAVHWRSNYCTR